MESQTPKTPEVGMETPVAAPRKAGTRSAPATKRGARGKASPGKEKKRRKKKDAAGGEPGPIGIGYRYAGLASRRVLIFVILVQLFLALTVVIPFWQGVAGQLDHHPHGSALAGSPTSADTALGWKAGLHAGVWSDVERELAPLLEGLTITHFWIALVAWLFGAVAAGGFLGTAVSGEAPVRVGAFLAQGGRWFGRMLRVGLVFGFFYYLIARIVLEAWGQSAASTEFMEAAETSRWWSDRLRELVIVLCFLWFRVAADWARADLVVYGRKSAIGAFFRGLWNGLRPSVLLTALAFGVPSLLLLVGLGFLTQWLTGDSAWTLIALFVTYQVAVGIRWAARAGLLAAFAARMNTRRPMKSA